MTTLERIAVFAAVLTLGGWYTSSTIAAEGKDDLWKVTASMTMEQPMSMTLPEFTTETCMPPNAHQGPPPMQNSDCTIDRFERDGDRTEYAVTCNQRGVTMTGEGWTEKSDPDHYRGGMSMSGSASGQAMKMHMQFSGTRIGHCTAEAVAE